MLFHLPVLRCAFADGPGRYGIDGTWSNFAFFIGSPAQVVYLTVATALSELWVVSSGGCYPSEWCLEGRC